MGKINYAKIGKNLKLPKEVIRKFLVNNSMSNKDKETNIIFLIFLFEAELLKRIDFLKAVYKKDMDEYNKLIKTYSNSKEFKLWLKEQEKIRKEEIEKKKLMEDKEDKKQKKEVN